MLFNSYIFIFIFLPLVLAGYYLLNKFNKHKLAILFLTLMSFWFYGYNNKYYLIILVISILLNHLLVTGMERYEARKKLFLACGVILDLGILFFFKYYDFFLDNLNTFIKAEDMPFLRLALPIGISFYTFQQLTYLIDFYHGECERYSLLEYANYVTFFPQLIAGPIVYHTELIPQFRDENNHHFNAENFARGVYAFACGLAKKVLVADIFARAVTAGFANVDALNSPSAIIVVLSFAIQVYFDFSGYCDMAYGIGYMFNVILPINFNSPFKSASISEFWNRWHMTLNRFFTKYVYIPLGGSRKGKVRTYINTLSVFLLSGLWHGANWSYIAWGGSYGVLACIDRAGKKYLKKIPRVLGIIINFVFFFFTCIFFRSNTIADALVIYKRIFAGTFDGISSTMCDAINSCLEVKALYRLGLGGVMNACPWFALAAYMLIVYVMCFAAKNTQEKVAAMKFNFKEIIIIAIFMIGSIISLSQISVFLYYNF